MLRCDAGAVIEWEAPKGTRLSTLIVTSLSPVSPLIASWFIHVLQGWTNYITGQYTVVMIRHGEKPSDPSTKDLSAVGKKRALRWSGVFSCWPGTDSLGLCGLGFAPQRLIARAAESPRFIRREVETLEPLSEVLGLEIEAFGSNETEKVAEGLTDGREDVVICWEHYDIGRFCGQILSGATDGKQTECPEEVRNWPDEEFGMVLVMTFGAGVNKALVEIEYDTWDG